MNICHDIDTSLMWLISSFILSGFKECFDEERRIIPLTVKNSSDGVLSSSQKSHRASSSIIIRIIIIVVTINGGTQHCSRAKSPAPLARHIAYRLRHDAVAAHAAKRRLISTGREVTSAAHTTHTSRLSLLSNPPESAHFTQRVIKVAESTWFLRFYILSP